MDDLPDLSPTLYAALKEDIENRGVLVPILRDAATDEILDGRIRVQICSELGIRDLQTVYVSQLSEDDRRDIRKSCNVYRRQLTRKQLHEWIDWEVRRTPEQSDRRIAGRIGVSHPAVAAARKRAGGKVFQLDLREGKDGKRYPAGRPSVYATTKGSATVARRILKELGDDAPRCAMSARMARKKLGQRDRENQRVESVSLPGEYILRCCDFRKHGLSPGSADLVCGDPPWKQAWAHNREDYAREVFRVLRPGGFAAIYTGHINLPQWLAVLVASGLEYQWIIACMHLGHAGVSRSHGTINSQWRPVVLLVKPGGKRLRSPHFLSDVLEPTEREKEWHPWQQPVGESEKFVRSLSLPGSLVVDLTCGSGTSGAACAVVGGRKYVGIDSDPRCVKIAKMRINETVGGTSKIAKTIANAGVR